MSFQSMNLAARTETLARSWFVVADLEYVSPGRASVSRLLALPSLPSPRPYGWKIQ